MLAYGANTTKTLRPDQVFTTHIKTCLLAYQLNIMTESSSDFYNFTLGEKYMCARTHKHKHSAYYLCIKTTVDLFGWDPIFHFLGLVHLVLTYLDPFGNWEP